MAGFRHSRHDVIMGSRMVKLADRGGAWKCENMKSSQKNLLEKLGTSISPSVPASAKA